MKKTMKVILAGFMCGWLLMIVLGRSISQPGCRADIRLEQVKHVIEELKKTPEIDEIENRIKDINKDTHKWRNPYTFELSQEEHDVYVIASPEYKSMYILDPWERIVFLNFKRYEFPIVKERITPAKKGLEIKSTPVDGGSRSGESE